MKFYYILFLALFCSFISIHSFAQWEEGNDEVILALYHAYFKNTNPTSKMKGIIFERENPLVVAVEFDNVGVMNTLQTALSWDKIKSEASEFSPTCRVVIANNDPRILERLFTIISRMNRPIHKNLDSVKEKGLSLLLSQPPKAEEEKGVAPSFDIEKVVKDLDVQLREMQAERRARCANQEKEIASPFDMQGVLKGLDAQLREMQAERQARSANQTIQQPEADDEKGIESPFDRKKVIGDINAQTEAILAELKARRANEPKHTCRSLIGDLSFEHSENQIRKRLVVLSDAELVALHEDCLNTHYVEKYAGTKERESDREGEERTSWQMYHRGVTSLILGVLQDRGLVK